MANRPGRVKALIARNVAEICQMELKNPHIGLVSVNEVKVSDDYSYCKVFVTFLGAKYPYQALEELKKTEGFVRSSLAKKMDLYKVPRIVFVYDESYDRAARIEEALALEAEELESLKKDNGED
ncbi:MAG: 30S ribosome-binding factor RbfA [Bacilli bacterium]|jgi:ribosome-binding factor A|nr:30S ribosome-binding factor RbfA [Bacilli bacterium]MCR5091476.1 30S ribosome-binding factor RbfA [Bacilli bacterium]MEE3464880.1 30S ribosome-binding factor RbfA [Candidatus Enteromonas sp.]